AIATREYAAPQGEIETTIAQIWQSLLGIERVGRHDDFFDLGGYSLTAIQVVGRIREQFGLTLPLAKVFQTPTIAALGEVIFNDQVARFDNDEIERLSAEIEQLSEDQLRALLN
ncbi:TPA: phosphopantetheine-binding protein, partial [Burkholderia cenocepacia]